MIALLLERKEKLIEKRLDGEARPDMNTSAPVSEYLSEQRIS